MPTIYLSNFASARTEGHHGVGRLFSIMVRTSRWFAPVGRVLALIPNAKDLANFRSERIDLAAYKNLYLNKIELRKNELSPGQLVAKPFERSRSDFVVSEHDTLCCTCSREKASSGECHRVWAAEALVEAGWNVVLDGKML